MKSKTTQRYEFDEHDVCELVQRALFQQASVQAPLEDIHWETTPNGGLLFSHVTITTETEV